MFAALDFRLNLAWKDEFLSWNASHVEGINQLRIDTKDIWVPDIEPFNAGAQKGLREREQVCLKDFKGYFQD